MEVKAESKNVRVAPRKVRLLAAVLPGKKAVWALNWLKNLKFAAASPLLLVIKQGIGNAVTNFSLPKEGLIIKTVEIGGGPTMKRWRPVARGQAHSIKKRTSQIKLVLSGDKDGSKS
jgi:large subunit ribosomal protein L22